MNSWNCRYPLLLQVKQKFAQPGSRAQSAQKIRGILSMNQRPLTLILSPDGGEEIHSRFMAPMCVRWLEVELLHEPQGRAGCPRPAAGRAERHGRSRRGEDTEPYPPRAVQGFKAQ